MLLYLICSIGVFWSVVGAVVVSPCKSGVMAPESVDLTNCEKEPCVIRKKDNITWSMVFTADDDHGEVITSLTATYMGVNKGYPGLDGKMSCDGVYSMPDNAKVGCPLQKGKQYRHDTIMFMNLPAPKITIPVKFALKDKNTKKDFVCYELTLQFK